MNAVQDKPAKPPANTAANDEALQPGSEQVTRWLETQCAMIKGFLSAHVLRLTEQNGSKKLSCIAALPERSTQLKQAMPGVKACLSASDQIVESDTASFSLDGLRVDRITFPLLTDDQQTLLLVLELEQRSEIMQRAVLNMLRWGQQWLMHAPAAPQQAAATAEATPPALLALAANTLAQDSFSKATTALATELASALRCKRVSIGRRKRSGMQVCAVSHNASFDHKTDSLSEIAAAMDEAIDQGDAIELPAPSGPAVVLRRAHKTLAASGGNPVIYTLPVAWQEKSFLAITLERHDNQAFSAEDQQLLQQLLQLLAPVLHLQQRSEQSLMTRSVEAARGFWRKLCGPKHGKLKFFSVLLVALLIFFSVASGEYRIASPAVVEGATQRVIVAPMDGFLAQANARAGDIVEAEQVLGQLQDEDLKLEQLRVGSEQQELLGEYREAMAEHDNAKVSIIGARIEQANAEMKLLNEQLKRTKLRAPFAGIVIEGDLSQALGAPVSRGDVLFKIAPLEDFKIILKVDERDIAGISAGQTGRLALTSLPGETLDVSVKKITAVSRAEDQRNYFRVEATVPGDVQQLRPGMEGIAKIETGERKLIWIWTHRLLDWLQLQIWSLLP